MIHYVASGGAKTNGCAKTSKLSYFKHKWAVNTILYVKHKANKGILEKVAIKRIILNEIQFKNNLPPIYQDTLNSLWNEDDLVIEEHAKSLVSDYLAWKEIQIAESYCKSGHSNSPSVS